MSRTIRKSPRELIRIPLPRQTGGAHKDQRYPARVNAKIALRKELSQ